jgi:acetyltransferase-like isoleucine patch superfamily enzyme
LVDDMRNDGGESIAPARSLLSRLARLAQEEVANVHVRLLLAEAASRALPQHTFNFTRTMIMRAAGFKIGRRSRIFGPIHVTGRGDQPDLLTIGTDCMIAGPLHVDLGASIRIGDRVHIGHHVVILTINHEIGPAEERCGGHRRLPVVVADGVWVGSRVTILPGVSVGAGSVIATGAVVARDVMPDTIVGGVPAKLLHDFPPADVAATPSHPAANDNLRTAR